MVETKQKRQRPGHDYGHTVDLVWYYASEKKDWSGCSCSACGRGIGLEERAVLLTAVYDKREALLCENCSWELLGIEWGKPGWWSAGAVPV